MKQHEQALLFMRKAAEDEALLVEVVSIARISNEIIGFHAQQASEKLLKALLSEFDVPFPRTHNLRLLMDLLSDAGHRLPSSLTDLDLLTAYGTLFRYEDLPVETHIDREAALAFVREVRSFVEKKIGDR
jgi:HEPN domain-containing protein